MAEREGFAYCHFPQSVALATVSGSLYEAVAAALASLRKDEWVGEIGTGLTTVRVEVLHPPVTHEVKMKDFQAWLQRKSGSPADVVLRDKLLEMLAGSRGGRP